MTKAFDALKRLLPERGSGVPTIYSRLRLILVIFLVGTLLLTLRLFDLQVVRANSLADTAMQFRSRTYTVPAERGQILDANGNVLAVSRERYNVAVNQELIQDYVRRDEDGNVTGRGVVAAAEDLAPIVGIEETRLAGIMLGGETKSTWVYLMKDVSPETWRTINAFGIPGIEPESYMKREYPNGDLGTSVIGFVGEDDNGDFGGQAGIEKTYDDILSGTDGSLTVEVSRGAVIPSGRRDEVDAVHGASIQLTIDADLEFALQEALQRSVDANSAEWGTAVVYEIGTGRILALADTNVFNPANPNAGGTLGSRAVQAPVEPGSTGKLLTYAAAIDQGTIDPLTIYSTHSPMEMPNGEVIRDDSGGAAEEFTVAGLIATSKNTGLVQVGDTISDETRYDYFQRFGLGETTGIELPAESSGILTPPETWGPRGHYTTMFGQGYAVTALQLAQVVATIGNDGVRVQPHIVDSITTADGNVEYPVVEDPVQAISPEAAQTMLELMQGATQPGATGTLAHVEGYNVAGKTGTAQVPDRNGALTGRVGTFAGVIPAEDPQIAVAVIVYNGAGAGYGGETAAPVFAEFSTFAMRHLGVPPSTTPLVRFPWRTPELNEARSQGQLDEQGRYIE